MNYEQKYKEALARAKEMCALPTDKATMEYIFPELKESENDRHRKWILEYLYDGLRKADEQFKPQFESAIAWLEKQQPLDKEELAEGALKHVARQFMNWLDASTSEYKMCLSNMECEDIEDAFLKDDWARIANYIKKKLEKQGEKLDADEVIEWLDADEVIEWLDRNSSMFWESPCNPDNIIQQFKEDFGL